MVDGREPAKMVGGWGHGSSRFLKDSFRKVSPPPGSYTSETKCLCDLSHSYFESLSGKSSM